MTDNNYTNNCNRSTANKLKKGNNSSKTFFTSAIVFMAIIGCFFLCLTGCKAGGNAEETEKTVKLIDNSSKTAKAEAKEENAFDLYYEAALKLSKMDKNDSIEKLFDEEPGKNISNAQELLNRYSSSLDLVKEAGKIKHFQVPEKYSGFSMQNNMETLDTSAIYKLTKLMTLSADYDGVNKKPMEAAGKYIQCINMGNGYGSYSALIGKIVDLAISRIYLDRLRRFLLSGNNSPEVYKYMIKEMLEQKKKQFTYNELSDSFLFDASLVYDMLISQKLSTELGNKVIKGNYKSEKKAAKIIHKELIRLNSLPFREAYNGMSERRITQASPVKSSLLSSNFKSSQKLFALTVNRDTAYNGAIITAAIMLYKAENGKYPASLSDLKGRFLPEIPGDPFAKDGKFIYKNKDGKVIFYSVGFNMEDDGGKNNGDLYDEKGDMVFLAGKK